MFFYLIKSTAWLLHVFYPIFSLPLHVALGALWAYSIAIQTGKDTIDPERINNGAPWYITKNCNIVESKTIRGYCMQAKSSFAVSVCMLYVSVPKSSVHFFIGSKTNPAPAPSTSSTSSSQPTPSTPPAKPA